MIDIEPKGLDLPKRKIPTELKKVEEKHEKPEITIHFLDRWSHWVRETAVMIATKAVQRLIPKWVWFVIIGLIVTVLLIVLL